MTKQLEQAIPWPELANKLRGELRTDTAHQILYATDASVYREVPRAVAFPKDAADVQACVQFAAEQGLSITPRAGGTSLAGQAVGAGSLVVDVSKYLREIVDINAEEGYVIVQPGVIRDQLNAALKSYGYWFGPNTSTANRCTLGGMYGNNSCGSTSITQGSVRDHIISAKVVLANGSQVEVTKQGFRAGPQVQGTGETDLPTKIVNQLQRIYKDPEQVAAIRAAFPKPEVTRRNTGYALDYLCDHNDLSGEAPNFDLAGLLAGSEGTLAFTTELTLNISPLPPPGTALAALHFSTVDGMMRAAQIAMAHGPFQCEVMDDTILNLARKNKDQSRNASFVIGNPRGLLLVEFRADSDVAALRQAKACSEAAATSPALAESYEVTEYLAGPEMVDRAWSLRKAGLGILGNMVGDAKAVACIEDTAVAVEDLADYIAEVETLMVKYQQDAVYYAHAGAGEIHLRPVLNLKDSKDRQTFYHLTRDVARLVKKYRGSLSGEHGDGRVRAAFLPEMLGEAVYGLCVDVKNTWDPVGIFNPGKIVEAPPMNASLRYEADGPTPTYPTALDWSSDEGLLRATEKCNGSGDCRKLEGGAMCPSYRATLSEQHGTRGRANTLREVLTRNQHEDPFQHPALAEAMDLCLSCKACTSECPSSVDMTNLKAEYLYQNRKTDLRTKLVAANEKLYRLGSKVPALANAALHLTGPLLKKVAGIAPARSLPPVARQTLRAWTKKQTWPAPSKTTINLFCDEFTNLQDVATGKATVQLLSRLGYGVNLLAGNAPSGRAHLSKGLLDEARHFAKINVELFAASPNVLVGMEPSAILSFRDEYPKLLRGELQEQAKQLATRTYTLDEFLYQELLAERLTSEDFGPEPLTAVLHVHCHEKALGDKTHCAAVLNLPTNFHVTLLDSGCCGMAGSFGYEAEHYDLSVKIAEQSLLRYLRPLPAGTVTIANGTSCRHQVKDLLGYIPLNNAQALLRSWAD